MNDSVVVPVIRVIVDRGKSKIRADVPEHEVLVLRAVHGEVEVQEIERIGERAFEPSAEAEYDRLVRAYRRANAPDYVRMVFAEGPFSLERFGFVSERGRATKSAKADAGPNTEGRKKAA